MRFACLNSIKQNRLHGTFIFNHNYAKGSSRSASDGVTRKCYDETNAVHENGGEQRARWINDDVSVSNQKHPIQFVCAWAHSVCNISLLYKQRHNKFNVRHAAALKREQNACKRNEMEIFLQKCLYQHSFYCLYCSIVCSIWWQRILLCWRQFK